MSALRWIARVEYRSAAGIVPVDHDIEEIEDLHDLVERGNDTIEAAEAR